MAFSQDIEEPGYGILYDWLSRCKWVALKNRYSKISDFTERLEELAPYISEHAASRLSREAT